MPTEADSSIPTVMDLTTMDTESEGDSVDDDGEFAEHHDGMHDAEPVENPIPRRRRLVVVGGGQLSSTTSKCGGVSVNSWVWHKVLQQPASEHPQVCLLRQEVWG